MSNDNQMKKALIKVATNLNDFIKENPNFINDTKSFWIENKRLNNQLKLIESHNNREIYRISEKYETVKQTLQFIFGERQTALNAHYAVLDKAIKSDDRELIIKSLQGASSIVSQHPLENFSEFRQIWDNTDETLYLDF